VLNQNKPLDIYDFIFVISIVYRINRKRNTMCYYDIKKKYTKCLKIILYSNKPQVFANIDGQCTVCYVLCNGYQIAEWH